MKKVLLIFFLICFTVQVAHSAGTVVTYVIDPEKNAFQHNNLGVMYVEEKNYYAAIQEFKMAISLNPKTQATGTYFNNLGKVYMIIGYPDLALDCYKNALIQYPLNFEYYQNLAKCYKALGQTNTKLEEYKKNKKTIYDNIMLALLYEQIGNTKKAIIILDDFASSEPDLLITPAVKNYIQKLVDSIL